MNGSGDVLRKDVLEARAGEGLGARIDEQFGHAEVASNREPCAQAACNRLPESKDALLPPFSHHADINIARANVVSPTWSPTNSETRRPPVNAK